MPDISNPITPDYLNINNRNIAYEYLAGDTPAIVWLGGYKSDMSSTKAEALMDWGRKNNRAVLRFDYSGHGLSSERFEDGTISSWLEDALGIIDAFAGIAPILVGSSMGGWIAILAALKMRAKNAPNALVLIAPATDFTQELMWKAFSDDIKNQIETTGVWLRYSQYSPDPTPVTKAFLDDGRKHLLFGKAFELGCKVHILQGIKDPDVPWQHIMRLVDHLPYDQVDLTMINDGDHRLSREQDIAKLVEIVAFI
jgi:pimeloyl-ACP methyl ester carboxylesterase